MGTLRVHMRETIRAWIEALEPTWKETIFEKRRGKRAALLRSILFAASKAVQLYLILHRFAIRSRLIRRYDPRHPGHRHRQSHLRRHGQNPGCRKVCPRIAKAGPHCCHSFPWVPFQAPAFRPDGLEETPSGRDDSSPLRLASDGKSLLLDSEITYGDEPYMLASNLKDVVVLVDKNRVKSGRYAIENFGCDTLLLDDGSPILETRRTPPGCSADRLSGTVWQRAFDSARTLREPPSHLSRASVVFITKSDGKTEDLRKRINEYCPGVGVIECIHAPLYFEDVFTGERKGLDFLKDKRIASISAIAQPGKF